MIANLLRNYMKVKFIQVIAKGLAGRKSKLFKGGFPVALATFLLEALFSKTWKDKSKLNKSTIRNKK